MNVINHINELFSSVSYRFEDILVDSGDYWEGFEGVSAVFLTHAHFDHIYGLNRVMEVSPGVRVYTNEHGKLMLLNAKKNMSHYNETPFVFEHPDNIVVVEDREEVLLENGLTAKAVFTPGHNPSCITWVIGDMVFTGDSLIPGVKTVTNLPGGNRNQALESENLIRQLAVGKTIYPGHKVD